MMQLVVFVLALVGVFAVNALIAFRTRDEIVSNSATFSWMSAKPEDADAVLLAAEDSGRVSASRMATPSVRRTAHAGI